MTAVACRFCKAPLHRAADLVTDEFVWVDEHGHQTGDDPDVADLKPDPYACLAALGERCVTGKDRKTALDLAAAREYSALKVRLETGGSFHVHQPDSPGPVHDGPVPEHCGWPGWLRPSGWQCRQCGASLAESG